MEDPACLLSVCFCEASTMQAVYAVLTNGYVFLQN